MKKVSWKRSVKYIDDEATVKTSNKKARIHDLSRLPQNTGPSAINGGWKQEEDDVPYSSENWQREN